MTYTFRLANKTYKTELEEKEKTSVVSVDGQEREIEFLRVDSNVYSLLADGRSITVGILKKGKKIQIFHEGDLHEIEAVLGREASTASETGSLSVTAPMHSRVVKILKNPGDAVEVGEGVIIVEAMKMESELRASVSGTVAEVMVAEGDTVEKAAVLVTLRQ